MIDKKIIAEKKAVYGDNFEAISALWSRTAKINLSETDVALMMADLKRVRIEFIDSELSKFPIPDVAIELHKSRDDSVTDRDNYMWIAENYDEYKKL